MKDKRVLQFADSSGRRLDYLFNQLESENEGLKNYHIAEEENAMIEQCKKRIENILNQYHPVLEPGEESITYEQAERLVEFLMSLGQDEDQAIEVVKYCTVGSDFVEEQPAGKADLAEKVDEACFYSRMAMQKAGHVGLLGMAIYVAGRARGKGKWEKATKGMLLGSMVLLVLDEVEVLVQTVRKMDVSV